MSTAELEQAQAESGESEESSEEIMRIQASENHELLDAVFEMETGKSYKDEGERMIKNAKEVLSNRIYYSGTRIQVKQRKHQCC